MKAFIWDLDGTLIDSYGVIEDSLLKTINSYKLPITKEEISIFIHQSSVKDFMEEICDKYNIFPEEFKSKYSSFSNSCKIRITLIPHTKEVLDYIVNNNGVNYIFTHKGESTFKILKDLEIDIFFKEIIINNQGFKRKPNPDGINYLIKKYNLNKDNTYYVGDRNLDMECALNANIKGILYLPDSSVVISKGYETYKVKDLREIKEIMKMR